MPNALKPTDVITGIDYDFAGLIDVWDESTRHLRSAASDADWDAPTPCPGWSVGDICAHVTSLERVALGHKDPAHEPDWSALPHAASDFGRLTEVPVDLRRSWTRSQVLDEFDSTYQDRLAQLRELCSANADVVPGPFGGDLPADRVMRMRILDNWIHEQDVRVASGRSGNWGARAAHVTAGQLVGGLGYVWGKKVAPPSDVEGRVEVTGEVSFRAQIAVLPNGRGGLVEAERQPATTVRLSWPDFMRLAAGRVDLDEAQFEISGDRVLGRALVENLTTVP